MADPLFVIGVIANIIQLVDFSAGVLARVKEYRVKSSEIPAAFAHIATQLPLLREVLERSKEGIKSETISPAEVKAIAPCLEGCQQQLEKLQAVLATILPEAQHGKTKRLTKAFRGMWKESIVSKIDAEIESYVSRLTFYYAWSASKLDLSTQNTRAELQQWLAAPDPRSNLRKSLKLRSVDTGQWYLRGDRYKAWKTGRGTFTWLYGAAGCGKTVLSAGIIEDLRVQCQNDPATSVAYFFFDFNDSDKQDSTYMVKSLLSQFLEACVSIPEALQSLPKHGRQPSEDELLRALRCTLELLPSAYIVLDAMDESEHLADLLDILEQMQSWKIPTTRVLVTSRREVDIEEALEESIPMDCKVCLESHVVNADIRTFVHSKLSSDKAFKRWRNDQDIREEIELVLGQKARGMFRWAACQLDTLAQCMTRGKVLRALQDLPKTLDDTYARILRAIDEGPNATEAIKILRWLTYAERPLTADEVLEVTGFVVEDEQPRFEEDDILGETHDIIRVCSSLVSVVVNPNSEAINTGDAQLEHILDEDGSQWKSDNYETKAPGKAYVRLAHFSVKEYLVSDRQRLSSFSLERQESHDVLAICCFVYLLRFKSGPVAEYRNDGKLDTDFPMMRYAAKYAARHSRFSDEGSKRQRDLCVEVLTPCLPAFELWLKLNGYAGFDWQSLLAHPLCFASKEGLVHAACTISEQDRTHINAWWGNRGSALWEASSQGHVRIVEALLARGADANAQDSVGRSALHEASAKQHEQVVQTLLANNVNVNTQDSSGGRVLDDPSMEGYENTVRMLLDAGAEVDAPGGRYQNAATLQTAATGKFKTALLAAVFHGHDDVVQILLDAGADVNLAGVAGPPIMIASLKGYDTVAQMLLNAGAHVNTQGPCPFGALIEASQQGHTAVVQTLLQAGAGADDMEGAHLGYATALQAASAHGHVEIVQYLLSAGADVNAPGNPYMAL